MSYPLRRPRRNRKTENMREILQETRLDLSDLIYPIFVHDGDTPLAIKTMPGIHRIAIKDLKAEVTLLQDLGLRCVALFPLVDDKKKSQAADEAFHENNLNHRAIRLIKKSCPEMLVLGDVALDPYSTLGHDGLVDEKSGEVLNDETIEVLEKMAVEQARAGVDLVGPSDMMDGRIQAIRKALDSAGFWKTGIMAYSAKYASAFYAPFREALSSAPKSGDKKSYQMNPANRKEALLEAELDVSEGADIIMVKPAMSYMDVISDLKANFRVPIAAYNVSGEYAMVKSAIENGLVGPEIVEEILLGFKRAGADLILTYFAKEYAQSKQ